MSPTLPPPPAPHHPRRVVVVFHEDVAGGATRSVLRAVPHLQALGWELSFWAARPSELYDELRASGYDVDGRMREIGFSLQWLRQPPGPATKLAAAGPWFSGLASFLRRRRPALVHANSIYTIADAMLARSLGHPVLLHAHEMLGTGAKADGMRLLTRLAHIRVASVSRASAAAFGGSGPTPPVVYESTSIPAAVGVRPRHPRPVVVGTVGWICPRKGSDIFVEAARLIRERGRDRAAIELRLVGGNPPGVHHDWGRQVLARARGADVVHLERADVFAQLREWDIFVLPSRFDPFPLVVLEAMASERPVIAADVDGIPEQVTGESGLLVPPESPKALADAIVALAADPQRRGAMGQAGRKRVAACFTPERQAASLDSLYRDLARLGT